MSLYEHWIHTLWTPELNCVYCVYLKSKQQKEITSWHIILSNYRAQILIRQLHINVQMKAIKLFRPVHEISDNVVCATNKASDQPTHMRSLIRAFANRLSIPVMIVKLLTEHHLEYLSLKGGCRGSSESTHVKISHCWKSHALAHFSWGLVYFSWGN